jgi:hypothetical protein
MQVKFENGVVQLDIATLAQDETVAREVAKHALTEEVLLTAFAQLAVDGSVDWDDESHPWHFYTTGKGERFENLRQIIAAQAGPVAAKLVADLTKERDGLYAQKEKLKAEIWQIQDRLRRAESEVRPVSPCKEYELRLNRGDRQ